MRRLDETSDDAYLDAGQQAEEALGSVNYDVWKCPSCNWHTLKPYRRWFSSTKVCPDCAYRTLRVRSHTVRRPTYFSTGTKQIDMSCSHCDFSDTDTVILPRLTRQESHGGSFTGSHSGSSAGGSTGGGSFGGGRSSGGGASGSW